MRIQFLTGWLICMSLAAFAQTRAQDFLWVDVGLVGTNVTFTLSDGRKADRDAFNKLLNRIASKTRDIEVQLFVTNTIPVGLLQSVQHDVRTNGFTNVCCVVTEKGGSAALIHFSTNDIPQSVDDSIEIRNGPPKNMDEPPEPEAPLPVELPPNNIRKKISNKTIEGSP